MSDQIITYIVNAVNAIQGLRKTLVMVALIVISVWFRLKGYFNGDNTVDLLKGTVIAFFAANGFEHMNTTIKEYINNKGQKVDETVLVDQKEEG